MDVFECIKSSLIIPFFTAPRIPHVEYACVRSRWGQRPSTANPGLEIVTGGKIEHVLVFDPEFVGKAVSYAQQPSPGKSDWTND